jgi:hypothetical protein
MAGLLHRLGDMLTIRALATVEHDAQVRLDSVGKADLCAELGIGLLDRLSELRADATIARLLVSLQ